MTRQITLIAIAAIIIMLALATIPLTANAAPVSQSQFQRLAKKVKRQGERIKTQEIRLDAYRERLTLLTTTAQYMLNCDMFGGANISWCASYIRTIPPLNPNPNHLREPLLSLSEIPPLTELP